MTFRKLTRLQCLRLHTERRNHFKLHCIKSPMTHTPCEKLSCTKDSHLNNYHNYIYILNSWRTPSVLLVILPATSLYRGHNYLFANKYYFGISFFRIM